ncbi:MAG: HAD family hydrolase, partial [Pseudomonadota bacterium]
MPFDALKHRDIWVFDLDNTLYPAECDLFAEIDKRMTDFIARFLRLDRIEARKVQKQYYAEHGTTLNGLMSLHGMDPADFLAHVHEIDLSPLPRTPDLASALKDLPGQKYIYTNGSRRHAERVTDYMGLSGIFDG